MPSDGGGVVVGMDTCMQSDLDIQDIRDAYRGIVAPFTPLPEQPLVVVLEGEMLTRQKGSVRMYIGVYMWGLCRGIYVECASKAKRSVRVYQRLIWAYIKSV